MTTLRQAAEMALECLEAQPYPRAGNTLDTIKSLRKALAEPEQEPVAIVNASMGGIEWLDEPLMDDTPLYTEPPQKQWVGLDEDEVWECVANAAAGGSLTGAAEKIQAKLREKNT